MPGGFFVGQPRAVVQNHSPALLNSQPSLGLNIFLMDVLRTAEANVLLDFIEKYKFVILYETPIFEWYVAWFVAKNSHQILIHPPIMSTQLPHNTKPSYIIKVSYGVLKLLGVSNSNE